MHTLVVLHNLCFTLKLVIISFHKLDSIQKLKYRSTKSSSRRQECLWTC